MLGIQATKVFTIFFFRVTIFSDEKFDVALCNNPFHLSPALPRNLQIKLDFLWEPISMLAAETPPLILQFRGSIYLIFLKIDFARIYLYINSYYLFSCIIRPSVTEFAAYDREREKEKEKSERLSGTSEQLHAVSEAISSGVFNGNANSGNSANNGGGNSQSSHQSASTDTPNENSWNYSSLDLMNSGASSFWKNYSGT